jgi:hypothetical protein
LVEYPIAGRGALIWNSQKRLVLRHKAFRRFIDPYFRMAETERRPVFVMRVDDREATLPLHLLLRELRIPADDDDARQLDLVARALNFVTGIRIGDLIPSEVLTGEASWTGDAMHQDLAVTRINLFILAWVAGYTAERMDRDMLDSLLGGKSVEGELSLALARLAEHVGIAQSGLIVRIAALAAELAHIEALREWLLRGAIRMADVLTRVSLGFTGDSSHMDTLVQIRRLCAKGIAEMRDEFAAVDRLLADPPTALRDCGSVIEAVRLRRDSLYCRWRAWEPFSREWGTIELRRNARTLHLANETYRFLAPRYMTSSEWRGTGRTTLAPARKVGGMLW